MNKNNKLSSIKVSNFSKQDKIYLVIGGLISVLARIRNNVCYFIKQRCNLFNIQYSTCSYITSLQLLGFAFFNEQMDTKR